MRRCEKYGLMVDEEFNCLKCSSYQEIVWEFLTFYDCVWGEDEEIIDD